MASSFWRTNIVPKSPYLVQTYIGGLLNASSPFSSMDRYQLILIISDISHNYLTSLPPGIFSSVVFLRDL